MEQYYVDHLEEVSKLAKVKAQVSEVKGVMMENIEKVRHCCHHFLLLVSDVLDRGEKSELLVDKTENLRSQFLYLIWLLTISGNQIGFVVMYSLTFFFANFGPNATTFVVSAEIFPARLREREGTSIEVRSQEVHASQQKQQSIPDAPIDVEAIDDDVIESSPRAFA
ncbi:hypothetical protein ACOSQ3_006495 [Xanthoceras sorbifolium]